jgi:hypothetical protein
MSGCFGPESALRIVSIALWTSNGQMPTFGEVVNGKLASRIASQEFEGGIRLTFAHHKMHHDQ